MFVCIYDGMKILNVDKLICFILKILVLPHRKLEKPHPRGPILQVKNETQRK
jgi:hypothetical protein